MSREGLYESLSIFLESVGNIKNVKAITVIDCREPHFENLVDDVMETTLKDKFDATAATTQLINMAEGIIPIILSSIDERGDEGKTLGIKSDTSACMIQVLNESGLLKDGVHKYINLTILSNVLLSKITNMKGCEKYSPFQIYTIITSIIDTVIKSFRTSSVEDMRIFFYSENRENKSIIYTDTLKYASDIVYYIHDSENNGITLSEIKNRVEK